MPPAARPETLPSLFLSHGSPMTPFLDCPARDFLAGLGVAVARRWGRPRAILVVSAHWETAAPRVTAAARHATIHDFYGFPRELYALSYPAPGAPDVAAQVLALLAEAGLEGGAGLAGEADAARGLDHGAWVPLMLAWPEADLPVVQLSLRAGGGPAWHVALGRALAPLREAGVLIIGSGSFTHDLARFRGVPADAPESADVAAFAGWMDRALAEGREEDLLAYRRLAPYGAAHHPTEEHLMPLYVALGAGAGRARRLHASTMYGFLRMDAYAFGDPLGDGPALGEEADAGPLSAGR